MNDLNEKTKDGAFDPVAKRLSGAGHHFVINTTPVNFEANDPMCMIEVQEKIVARATMVGES